MNEIFIPVLSGIIMICLNIFPMGMPIVAMSSIGGSMLGSLLGGVAVFGGSYISLCWILHKMVPDSIDEV